MNGTQTWGGSEQSPAGAPASDWGGHNPSTQTWAAPEQPALGWGAAPAQQQGFPAQQAPGAGALPAEGAQPPSYGEQRPYGDQQQPPSYGGQETSSYGGQQDSGYGGHQGGAVPPHQPQGAAALPPAVPGALPPAVDEGATQYIPPVGPGALPPEVSSGPLPPAAHPDAEATQYIAPVPAEPGAAGYGIRPGGPEDRQPPAEFDNLFRSASGAPSASEGPSSTQQLPRFEAPTRTPRTPRMPRRPRGCPERRAGGPPPGVARPTTATAAGVDGAARASR